MFAYLKGVHWIGLGEYRGSSKRTICGDTSEPCKSCQGAPSQSGPDSFAAHSPNAPQRRSLYILGWFGPRVSGAHSSPQMDFSLESVLPKICSRLWTVGRAAGWIHLFERTDVELGGNELERCGSTMAAVHSPRGPDHKGCLAALSRSVISHGVSAHEEITPAQVLRVPTGIVGNGSSHPVPRSIAF
jgi:hypothetical protein